MSNRSTLLRGSIGVLGVAIWLAPGPLKQANGLVTDPAIAEDREEVSRAEIKSVLDLVRRGEVSAGLKEAEALSSSWERKGETCTAAELWRGVTHALIKLQDCESAKLAAHRVVALERLAHATDAHQHMAKALHELGVAQFQLGNVHQAFASLEEALTMMNQLTEGNQPDVAECLNDTAVCLYHLGNAPEALRRHQDALAMQRSLFKGDDPDVASSLCNIGACFETLGHPQEALASHQEALEMYRRLFDGDHPEIARCLNNIGTSLLTLGQVSDALEMNGDSLAMYTRLGGNYTAVGTSVNNIGACLEALGRSTEALTKFNEALEIYEWLFDGDHPGVARSLNNVGACLVDLGRPREALEKLSGALTMYKRLLKGDNADLALCLGNIGISLEALGRSREALAKSKDALAMLQRLFDQGHSEVAKVLDNLGTSLASLGHWPEALVMHQEAQKILNQLYGDDHRAVARVHNNLGACLASLGREADALEEYKKALAMGRRLGVGEIVIASLNNVGVHLENMDCASEALALHEEALLMSRRLFGGDHPTVGASLNNLASCFEKLGAWSDALAMHEEALAMSQRIFEGDHPDTARDLNNAGICLRRLGRTSEAKEKIEAAVEMSRRLGPATFHLCASNIAAILLELGEIEEASAVLTEAILNIEHLRGQSMSLGEQDRISYFTELRRFGSYHQMIDCQLRLGSATDALQYLERGRARGLLDLLERRETDLLALTEQEANQLHDATSLAVIRDTQQRWTAADREVGALRHRVALLSQRMDLDPDERAAQQARILDQLEEELKTLQELGRQRQQLIHHHIPLARVANIAEIQAALVQGEVLLAFSMGEKSGHAFLLPPEGEEIQSFDLALARDQLGESVTRLRGNLHNRRSGVATWAGASHEIFGQVIPPAFWERLCSASLAYVVADAHLHQLPLEALVVEAPQGTGSPVFWLDRGPPIAYVPSGSVLLECRRRRHRQRTEQPAPNVLALGHPIFDWPAVSTEAAPEDGVLVTRLSDTLRGLQTGLQRGDVILEYGGEVLFDDRHLRECVQAAVDSLRAGECEYAEGVPLSVWRKGEGLNLFLPPRHLESLGIEVASEGEANRRGYEETLRTRRRSSDLLRYGQLSRLPNSRTEVTDFFELFAGEPFTPEAQVRHNDVKVLLGEQALESILFAEAPRARIVHLATHYVINETPFASQSALALTLPANPAIDDGFLTVSDLVEHWRDRLRGTQLVVVSACSTAIGPLQRHDAPLALPWGLFYAGAPTVISTLWDVHDEATAILMRRFYQNLLGHFSVPRRVGLRSYGAGQPLTPLLALSEAKHWLRSLSPHQLKDLGFGESDGEACERGDPIPAEPSPLDCSHPYYWAPIVLSGCPD